jgi:hypothetical protein
LEQLRSWRGARIELPIGSLICVIATVHARRAPMMSATAGLQL